MKLMSVRDQTQKVWVGPAGWDYADWKGVVYPAPAPKGFDRLGYIARYFDTVEINSTFYGPARAETARAWLAHVADNPRFRFTAKLWRRFTHERGAAWTAADVRAVRDGFDALAASGRLGAVLLQFPWSFRRDDAAEEWLRDLFAAFTAYPLVLEVRHASWNSGDVLADLAARGVGLVNVDQPLFHDSIGPAAHATGGCRLRAPARAQLPAVVPRGAPPPPSATTTSTRRPSFGPGWRASARSPRVRASARSTPSPTTTTWARRPRTRA